MATPGEGQTREGRLHLLLSAERSALDDCLALVQVEDVVLLLDRGVRFVLDETVLDRLRVSAGSVLASAADLEARGLRCPDPLPALDDQGWARLVRDHAVVLSWT